MNARWLPMIPLLLLAMLLAAPGLNGDLIWFDELTSISHAGGVTGPFSPLEIAESVREHSPKHTPLFFELLAVWGALVGWHQAVLRALPMFCGLLALAWIYRLGADFINFRAGLWACLLLSLNAFWIDYLHEIRMYTLQFALLAALAWHYLTVMRAGSAARRLHWAGLIAFAALSLYAQPFSIFFLVALGAWHLRWVRHRRMFWRVGMAMLVAGLFYLPWLPVTLHGVTAKFDTGADAMALSQALAVFLRLLGNGQPVLLLMPLLCLCYACRKAGMRLLPFLFLSVVCLLALLIANEWVGLIPLRRARYFMLVWGMLAVAFGGGFALQRWPWAAPAFFVMYAIAGFTFRSADDYLSHQGTVYATQLYPPLEAYTRMLRGRVEPLDYVVGFTDADFVNRAGKQGKSTADYYFETLLGLDGTLIPSAWTDAQLHSQLDERLASNPFLLLAHDPRSPPDSLAATTARLRARYAECETALEAPQLLVQRYVDSRLPCQRVHQPIAWDNGIRIVDRFGEYDAASSAVRIVTGWEVDDRDLLHKYNVSLQLHSADNRNLAQVDRHLYDGILKWYTAELSTVGLSPGEYRAVVIVYDRYTKAKVSGIDLKSGETATIFPVLRFMVDA